MSSLAMSDPIVSDSELLVLNIEEAKKLVQKALARASTPVPVLMSRQIFLLHLHFLGATLDEKEDDVLLPRTISFS